MVLVDERAFKIPGFLKKPEIYHLSFSVKQSLVLRLSGPDRSKVAH